MSPSLKIVIHGVRGNSLISIIGPLLLRQARKADREVLSLITAAQHRSRIMGMRESAVTLGLVIGPIGANFSRSLHYLKDGGITCPPDRASCLGGRYPRPYPTTASQDAPWWGRGDPCGILSGGQVCPGPQARRLYGGAPECDYSFFCMMVLMCVWCHSVERLCERVG
jgi:hypothetical protein